MYINHIYGHSVLLDIFLYKMSDPSQANTYVALFKSIRSNMRPDYPILTLNFALYSMFVHSMT